MMPEINKEKIIDNRKRLVEYVRKQLIGPYSGADEVLHHAYRPADRYLMGKLYPVDSETADNEEDQEQENEAAAVGNEWSESPISLAFQRLPASMGLSFFLNGNGSVKVSVFGAKYSSTASVHAEFTWNKDRDAEAKAKLSSLKDNMDFAIDTKIKPKEYKAFVTVDNIDTSGDNVSDADKAVKLINCFASKNIRTFRHLKSVHAEFTWNKDRDAEAKAKLSSLKDNMDFAISFDIKIYDKKYKAFVTVDIDTSCDNESDADKAVKLINCFASKNIKLVSLVSKPLVSLVSLLSKPNVEKFWKRSDLSSDRAEFLLTAKDRNVDSVLGGGADLRSYWRPVKKGHLVTLTLVNVAMSKKGKQARIEDSRFQIGLEVFAAKGKITAYPRTYIKSLDEEEEELNIIYRDNISYAVGHGCSVEWDLDDKKEVSSLKTVYLPSKEVPEISPEIPGLDNRVMSLQLLADTKYPMNELKKLLLGFIESYEVWLTEQKKDEVEAELSAAKARIIGRIEKAAERMRKGVLFLEKNQLAREVFTLANRAMLMQMVHSEFAKCRKGKGVTAEPDYFSEKFSGILWRPFQLAFQLLAIESVLNEKSDDREIVDMIWFPTGGGKTEAYLVLAAMEIFHRRLKHKEKGYGTAVLKRYTLRLLTSQQFERASRLICACETIRKGRPGLGAEPISLGLWVGEGSSPNAYTKATGTVGALEKHKEALNAEKPEIFFSLTACPWCGTSIYPESNDDDDCYGVKATETSFKIFCPEENCAFHDEIPVNVVDEHLYKYPPTLVVATIDKLARAAWDSRSRTLFGRRCNGENVIPPTLVIQDELHLISGPLGTVAGVYECAFNVLMGKPKIIAATATIRRAGEQVRQLYGRDVNIFPPPGMKSSDSFYSRQVPFDEAPGRLYVGCMGQGATAVYSQVQLSAAIALAPIELGFTTENGDGYWTQVTFHNSKRDLGKTMTLAEDDIPSRIELITKDGSKARNLKVIRELSANCRGEEIPQILDEMKIQMNNEEAIDILPCTNMLSVGVDIQRLGLMLINGQPKTTAEYIQATGRVGRGNFPGLVFAHYSPTRPRDRSHYETFFAYHDALYRAVEPTSVTPYAEPSLKRSLHASLIILMRHGAGLTENEDASRLNTNNEIQSKLLIKFRERIQAAAPFLNSPGAMTLLDERIKEWREKIEESQRSGKPLRFYARAGIQFSGLICKFENKIEGLWPTLNSMRHVDSECQIKVFGEGINR
jgi:hypothetical protein